MSDLRQNAESQADFARELKQHEADAAAGVPLAHTRAAIARACIRTLEIEAAALERDDG